MKRVLIFAALIAAVSSVSAQDAMKVIRVTPDAITWKDNPAIPKGGQIVVLQGDPTKSGDVVVQRVKLPANYRVPPHTHPYAENVVTVISSRVGLGMGEKFDPKEGDMVTAGAFFSHPAKHAHYVWTGSEEAIVQVQFTGPGGIDYINPADDPRRK